MSWYREKERDREGHREKKRRSEIPETRDAADDRRKAKQVCCPGLQPADLVSTCRSQYADCLASDGFDNDKLRMVVPN